MLNVYLVENLIKLYVLNFVSIHISFLATNIAKSWRALKVLVKINGCFVSYYPLILRLDFSYIIKRYAPAQICFGSTLERETLPKDARLMNSFMRRKNPTVAIAADDTIHPKDEEPVKCHCKELTKNGYGPLASKVPRFAPEPTKKAKNDKLVRMVLRNEPIQVMKQCAQPFGRSMKQRDTASNTPGYNNNKYTYDLYLNVFIHCSVQSRSLQWRAQTQDHHGRVLWRSPSSDSSRGHRLHAHFY